MSSSRWIVAFAIGFMLVYALGSPAAAQLGGNPGDAFSCYSDCGVRGGNATQRCACDDMCNARGDCCSDRNLYCSVSMAAPACSLTSNNVETRGNIFCGTDLGFVVQHGSKLEVLFGDSWEYDPLTFYTTCNSVGALGASDDSQGTLPVTRPSSMLVPLRAASIPASGISDCNASILTLDTNQPAGLPRTYSKLRLRMPNGEELQLLPGSTPTAAFSDGVSMWAMFKANGPPERAEPGHTYLAYRQTTARTDYRVRVDLGKNDDNLFLNPSATRITSYNPTDPKLSNFALPSGTNAGELLIFGRKKFWSGSAEDADANGMYLVRQATRISTSGTPTWKPMYFKGIDPTTDKPIWSDPNDADGANDANEAVPMLTVPGPGPAGDFKAVNEIDVKWVPELRKWILLYGGDVHWTLESDPPTTDQPRHGAIHMRMADYPWGPWSPPTPLLWREKMRGYFECDATASTTPAGCDPTNYPTGTWQPDAGTMVQGCTTALPEPVQPNGLAFNNLFLSDCFINNEPIWDQRGLLYAPELIPTWTNVGAANATTLLRPVTIYFLVSTWMPYQVVLAAADLNVPIATFKQGRMVVQLRDYQNKLVTLDTLLPPDLSSTINKTTAWWVQHTDAMQPDRPIQIGDTVYFRSMNDDGLTYLSRNGDNVQFEKPTVLDDRFKWRVESIDPVKYPVGMNIEYGKTPFLIRDLGTRRLQSKAAVLRNLVDSGADSIWTMTWHCQGTDACP